MSETHVIGTPLPGVGVKMPTTNPYPMWVPYPKKVEPQKKDAPVR